MSEMKRTCPVGGCRRTIGRAQLLCPTHWYMVPKERRDRIWKSFKANGKSPAHRELCFESIRDVCRTVRGAAK